MEGLTIFVKIVCEESAKSKAAVLENTKVGDILLLEYTFRSTYSKAQRFFITNLRTNESAVYSFSQFSNAIWKFRFRQTDH